MRDAAGDVGRSRSKVLTARTSRDGGDSWDHYAKLEEGPPAILLWPSSATDGRPCCGGQVVAQAAAGVEESNPKPVEEDVIVFARVRVGAEAPQIITRPAMKMKRDEL